MRNSTFRNNILLIVSCIFVLLINLLLLLLNYKDYFGMHYAYFAFEVLVLVLLNISIIFINSKESMFKSLSLGLNRKYIYKRSINTFIIVTIFTFVLLVMDVSITLKLYGNIYYSITLQLIILILAFILSALFSFVHILIIRKNKNFWCPCNKHKFEKWWVIKLKRSKTALKES